ncbi:hypothetical protein BK764_11580 [Bacillus thuringiensis serovar israelensis]|uniref:Uncharacterized protein n=4 Tax=Bacillaceae TaxID=186817 RepID=A0A0B5NK02_BACTU|nr:hypothetical protein BTF1_29937 [Bacillus thuringiensis HD-789]AJG74231.1 hypothetical protein BF38_5890 [Bacillus thuringiensis]AJH03029.1 hypothetical protein AS86_6467 [Bacillus thuringiensis HD1002]AND28336.1 hypothetical protein ATN07_32100 [Bacillus thuringiensis serovar israelensis]EAO57003.1 hypothetical protein RBTH_07747 [Bacillus thuringiensis serovar israelensis ATCC 35646]EEM74321.1 hypothetical protein bthur0010_56750 [Bacillus thuringiensis serovar pondicheriensis BGSC 4BA1]
MMKTVTRKKTDRLSVVRTKKQVSAIPIEFEFRNTDEEDFGTIFIDGVVVFRFNKTNARMNPQKFSNGKLSFTDSKFRDEYHFNFNTISEVKDLVKGIGLTENKLIVQVHDQYQERKLQLVYVAPSWLIQREKERMK